MSVRDIKSGDRFDLESLAIEGITPIIAFGWAAIHEIENNGNPEEFKDVGTFLHEIIDRAEDIQECIYRMLREKGIGLNDERKKAEIEHA